MKREIDIEIKDLIWEFFRRWRLIIVCGLICGLAIAGMQYYSDYQKANASTVVTVKEKTVEEAMESLTLQEHEAVTGAVTLKKQIDCKSLYLKESILMNTNPFAQDVVILQYHVNGSIQPYIDYVNTGSISQSIAEAGIVELEEGYISELITIEVKDEYVDSTFSVRVSYSDKENCIKLADEVDKAISQYEAVLNSQNINSEISLISESVSVVINDHLAEKQTEYALDISTNQTSLNKIKNEMIKEQIIVFNDLVEKSYGLEEVETDENTENVSAVVEKHVTFSMKYLVIGVVVGVVLAVGYIFVAFIATPYLRNECEVEELYSVRMLGTVSYGEYQKKKFLGGIDKLLKKIRFFGRKQLSKEQQLQMIASNIYILCKKKAINNIYLAGTDIECISESFIADFKDKLEEKGIQFTVGNSIIYDAEALLAAEKHGAIVFVERKYESLYSEILKEVKISDENSIEIAGIVVLGE